MTNVVEDWATLQHDMQDAIAGVVAKHGMGSLVTKYVVIAETVDPGDGERCAWMIDQPNARRWDVLGLLAWGSNMEQSGQVANIINDAIDDD